MPKGKVTDLSELKNELRKYKHGKKLDIRQFNQAARLAWLGKIVMQPLDPTDAETKSYLLYVDHPEELPAQIMDPDEDLVGQIHILDSEQGYALAQILEEGMYARVGLYRELAQRDFYFEKFYTGGDKDSARTDS